MDQKWNERYKNPTFAYGKEPNLFFKEWIQQFKPGTILLPADGEGRNGVYAASLGWQVTSFDTSIEGQTKALGLAREQGVQLNYLVGELEQLDLQQESFDVIALVYAHIEAEKKASFLQQLNKYLKPGGFIIFEAFSKNHLHYNQVDPKVGGPKDINMLFSTEEISACFENYAIQLLEETEVMLQEGIYHIGKGSVIRFIGKKPVS